MTYENIGSMPVSGNDNPVHAAIAEATVSERERRLENICRRMLPATNISLFDQKLRRDLLCEFAELRSTGFHKDEVEFTGGKCIFWFDCPLIVTATVGDREAVLMRVPEEEAGFDYLMMMPSARVMEDLKEGRICLREACIHEQTILFYTDDCIEGVAFVLRGPIHEYLLPEKGFLFSEIDNSEEMDMTP
jgi:hypothetical protein